MGLLPRSFSLSTCRCGHGKVAHEHYRRGSDCGLCDCPRFRVTLSLAQPGGGDDRPGPQRHLRIAGA